MMPKILLAVAIFIVAAAPICARQQSNVNQSNEIKEENEKRLQTELDKAALPTKPAKGNPQTQADPYGIKLPEPPSEITNANIEPTVKEKLNAAQIAYYDYRAEGLRHRSRVFVWQFISSIVIFIVVIILVGVGVYFSWVQFTASQARDKYSPSKKRRLIRKSIKTQSVDEPERGVEASALDAEKTATSENSQITEIEASLQGIRVSSPVLGVIILIISLLFFYLYLVHVYPINDVY